MDSPAWIPPNPFGGSLATLVCSVGASRIRLLPDWGLALLAAHVATYGRDNIGSVLLAFGLAAGPIGRLVSYSRPCLDLLDWFKPGHHDQAYEWGSPCAMQDDPGLGPVEQIVCDALTLSVANGQQSVSVADCTAIASCAIALLLNLARRSGRRDSFLLPAAVASLAAVLALYDADTPAKPVTVAPVLLKLLASLVRFVALPQWGLVYGSAITIHSLLTSAIVSGGSQTDLQLWAASLLVVVAAVKALYFVVGEAVTHSQRAGQAGYLARSARASAAVACIQYVTGLSLGHPIMLPIYWLLLSGNDASGDSSDGPPSVAQSRGFSLLQGVGFAARELKIYDGSSSVQEAQTVPLLLSRPRWRRRFATGGRLCLGGIIAVSLVPNAVQSGGAKGVFSLLSRVSDAQTYKSDDLSPHLHPFVEGSPQCMLQRGYGAVLRNATALSTPGAQHFRGLIASPLVLDQRLGWAPPGDTFSSASLRAVGAMAEASVQAVTGLAGLVLQGTTAAASVLLAVCGLPLRLPELPAAQQPPPQQLERLLAPWPLISLCLCWGGAFLAFGSFENGASESHSPLPAMWTAFAGVAHRAGLSPDVGGAGKLVSALAFFPAVIAALLSAAATAAALVFAFGRWVHPAVDAPLAVDVSALAASVPVWIGVATAGLTMLLPRATLQPPLRAAVALSHTVLGAFLLCGALLVPEFAPPASGSVTVPRALIKLAGVTPADLFCTAAPSASCDLGGSEFADDVCAAHNEDDTCVVPGFNPSALAPPDWDWWCPSMAQRAVEPATLGLLFLAVLVCGSLVKLLRYRASVGDSDAAAHHYSNDVLGRLQKALGHIPRGGGAASGGTGQLGARHRRGSVSAASVIAASGGLGGRARAGSQSGGPSSMGKPRASLGRGAVGATYAPRQSVARLPLVAMEAVYDSYSHGDAPLHTFFAPLPPQRYAAPLSQPAPVSSANDSLGGYPSASSIPPRALPHQYGRFDDAGSAMETAPGAPSASVTMHRRNLLSGSFDPFPSPHPSSTSMPQSSFSAPAVSNTAVPPGSSYPSSAFPAAIEAFSAAPVESEGAGWGGVPPAAHAALPTPTAPSLFGPAHTPASQPHSAASSIDHDMFASALRLEDPGDAMRSRHAPHAHASAAEAMLLNGGAAAADVDFDMVMAVHTYGQGHVPRGPRAHSHHVQLKDQHDSGSDSEGDGRYAGAQPPFKKQATLSRHGLLAVPVQLPDPGPHAHAWGRASPPSMAAQWQSEEAHAAHGALTALVLGHPTAPAVTGDGASGSSSPWGIPAEHGTHSSMPQQLRMTPTPKPHEQSMRSGPAAAHAAAAGFAMGVGALSGNKRARSTSRYALDVAAEAARDPPRPMASAGLGAGPGVSASERRQPSTSHGHQLQLLHNMLSPAGALEQLRPRSHSSSRSFVRASPSPPQPNAYYGHALYPSGAGQDAATGLSEVGRLFVSARAGQSIANMHAHA